MFTVGDDGSLELLTRGPALRHPTLVYGPAPYLLVNPSTSVRACSGLNPYAGPYYLSTMTSQRCPIGKTMLQPTLVYGPAPYLLVNPSTSVGACSGLNPYAGPYYLSTMTSQRRSIGKTMLQPLTGASSSSLSGETPDRDSVEDYPEIRGSACWNPAMEAHCINMVGPTRGNA
jgi:hypothetical protein